MTIEFFGDMPFSEYIELESASSHGIATIVNRSPRYYRDKQATATPAKNLGSLVHLLVGTPALADTDVHVRPAAPRNTNAGKLAYLEWMCWRTGLEVPPIPEKTPGNALDSAIELVQMRMDALGGLVVSQAEYDTGRAMADSVLGHPLLRRIYERGAAEQSLVIESEEFGCKIKTRADWRPEGEPLIVDLKSAACASKGEFERAAARYNYPIQAWLYAETDEQAGFDRPEFWHVVVESEPPHDVALHIMSDRTLRAGERKAREGLDIYRRCVLSGRWPGLGWDWERGRYAPIECEAPFWYGRSAED